MSPTPRTWPTGPRLYCAMWREHRLTEIVYVFEREKDRYLKILES